MILCVPRSQGILSRLARKLSHMKGLNFVHVRTNNAVGRMSDPLRGIHIFFLTLLESEIHILVVRRTFLPLSCWNNWQVL